MSTAVELLSKGSLPEILTSLAPAKRTAAAVERFVDLPAEVVVTAKLITAVERLGLTTEGYTPVVVQSRSELSQLTIDELSAERDAIDELEKFIKARKEAHRAMVFNHLDVLAESARGDETLPTDDKGHYLVKQSVLAQGGSRKFDRQISTKAPSVSAEGLAEAEENVEGFSHDDFLACTTQVRVLDEEKTLIHLRTNPQVLDALRYAVKAGESTASLYHRKA